MASTTGEGLAISVPELVQQDEVSNWARLALGHLPEEPSGPVTERELVTAIEEKHEQDCASGVRDSQVWSALDQLLHISFALISPAYLFNSFPPFR
jgi:hypothetical protein